MNLGQINMVWGDGSGRQALNMKGLICVLPQGIRAVEMFRTTPLIVGYYTPAYTWGKKIRINPRWMNEIDVQILVEECIHAFQYRRMKIGFFPTYMWQNLINVFRKRKSVSLHNANIMEKEAMGGAKEIVRNFDYNNTVIDIEVEIKKYFGW